MISVSASVHIYWKRAARIIPTARTASIRTSRIAMRVYESLDGTYLIAIAAIVSNLVMYAVRNIAARVCDDKQMHCAIGTYAALVH